MRKVLIFDTSVLCCLLKIPKKEIAGSANDRWDHDRIADIVKKGTRDKAVFVLPLATIIETGNHISQAASNRREIALELAIMIGAAADAASPWAPFTDQADLWGAERLRRLANDWPDLATAKISIGDATIKDVAEHYTAAGFEVEILTGDAGLKAYEPIKTSITPRRRA